MRTLLFSLCLIASSIANAVTMDDFYSWRQVQLSINNSPFTLFVAETAAQHAQGLMHVKHMPHGQGVLFSFEKDEKHCMWMKNTLIPLKVIFLDAEGNYINDVNMTPHDLTAHCSNGNSQYAIELNQDDPALTNIARY